MVLFSVSPFFLFRVTSLQRRLVLQPGDIFSNFNCVAKSIWGHPAELKGRLKRSVNGTHGMMSIASVAYFCLGLKPFRPIRTIAGQWDVG